MDSLHTKKPVLFLLCFGFMSVGCGDSSGTSWGGTYTVSSWTENEASCDAEGASIADQHDPFMNIDYCTVRLGGYSYSTLQLVGCADETACAEPVCPEDGETSLFQGGLPFGSGSDSSGWFGESAAAETSNDGGCYGIYGSRTLKKQEDGSLRLEIKTHANFEYEKDEEWCTETEKVKSLGPNEPCESLEVVILTPVAPAAAE